MNNRMQILLLPENPALPFFAYGFFKSGELAFYRIKKVVDEYKSQDAIVKGNLYEKDGVPLFTELKPNNDANHPIFSIHGELLYFTVSGVGYRLINEIEPASLYGIQEVSGSIPLTRFSEERTYWDYQNGKIGETIILAPKAQRAAQRNE